MTKEEFQGLVQRVKDGTASVQEAKMLLEMLNETLKVYEETLKS